MAALADPGPALRRSVQRGHSRTCSSTCCTALFSGGLGYLNGMGFSLPQPAAQPRIVRVGGRLEPGTLMGPREPLTVLGHASASLARPMKNGGCISRPAWEESDKRSG